MLTINNIKRTKGNLVRSSAAWCKIIIIIIFCNWKVRVLGLKFEVLSIKCRNLEITVEDGKNVKV